MSIFSRRNTQDAFAPENTAVEAEAPPPIAQVTPEMMEDDNAMRRYIKERLIVESQMAPTAAAQIGSSNLLKSKSGILVQKRVGINSLYLTLVSLECRSATTLAEFFRPQQREGFAQCRY